MEENLEQAGGYHEKLTEMRGIINSLLSGTHHLDVLEDIAGFRVGISESHADLDDYRLWHVLDSVDGGDDNMPLDLPSGEIEKFIRKLQEKYSSRE